MRDPTVDLWALDEVHFQQHGSRCRMWIPPECRDPIVLHHPTRKGVGYFGTVRLRDGKLVTREESDRFDGVSCWTFLKHLRQVSAHAGRRVGPLRQGSIDPTPDTYRVLRHRLQL